MPDRAHLEALLVANVPVIDRAIGALARRHGLSADEADELGGWVRVRLVENDYGILGKFRGESSLATYLAVVVATLYREYRVAEWGRWRPSAAARRAGDLAVRLETLMRRDGLSLAHAAEMLRTRGETSLSDRELGTIAQQLPLRAPLRPVQSGLDSADVPGASRADELVEREEASRTAAAVRGALDEALGELPDEDRLVVRLHYLEAMTVAEISRGLALPQKPLYKRLERSLRHLRSALERAGVSRDHVAALGAAAE